MHWMWIWIWMCPTNIPATLVDQALGSHLEIWVTPGQQMMAKCSDWWCRPNQDWSHINVRHIQGVWQPSYAVDVYMDAICAGATPSFEHRFRRDCYFWWFLCCRNLLIHHRWLCRLRWRICWCWGMSFQPMKGQCWHPGQVHERCGAVSWVWLPVAGARAPFRMWNIADDTRPVGIDGSSLRKALNVAPVLLTADGIVPFNTPMRILCCAASGLMRYVCACRVGVRAAISCYPCRHDGVTG